MATEQLQGKSFVRHEFDEAIVIQKAIVETEQQLSKAHPLAEAKKEIERMVGRDEEQLRELERLGKGYGATGKKEEVAGTFEELASQLTESASGGPASEAYEAHAVLLTMKRKQLDAALAMRAIADEMGNEELTRATGTMEREMRTSSDRLAELLSDLAVDLATRDEGKKH